MMSDGFFSTSPSAAAREARATADAAETNNEMQALVDALDQ